MNPPKSNICKSFTNMWLQIQCRQHAVLRTFSYRTVVVYFRVEQSEFMEFSEVSGFFFN